MVSASSPELGRVERVLRVDEGRHAAGALRVGDHVEGEGRLAGGFGAEELDDASAREAADAEGEVEGEGAGADDRDVLRGGGVSEAHDGGFAEFLADLREDGVELGGGG